MGVEVSNYSSSPALDYKYFFMERLEVEQSKLLDDNAIPKFSMKIEYRMYAIDQNGQRHFKNKINFINIDDYMEIATLKAQAQDTDLLDTAVILEYAIAKIAESTTNIGSTSVI